MSCSGESVLSSRKQSFFRKAGSFFVLYQILIILAGFIRPVVLLSDLMQPARSSPNIMAEPVGTSSICSGKVEIDPLCCLFCTDSNQYKILLK